MTTEKLPMAADTACPERRQALWSRFQARFYDFLTVVVYLTMLYVLVIIVGIGIEIAYGYGAFIKAEQKSLWDYVHYPLLFIHGVAAVPPLLLGLVGFNRESREKNPRFHRRIGKWYVFGIWISSVTGIMLAATNQYWIGKFGFGTLGVLWFVTTTMAYKTARRKDFVAHRRWMIRSYALTLAVVAVRPMFLYQPPFLDPATWYVTISWLCWVPNYIAAEIYVRITRHSGKLRPF